MRTVVGFLIALAPLLAGSAGAPPPLPQSLRETGFYALEKTEFTPHFPLWSDGAAKRRWIHLPPGTAIDKSDPDRWEFPAGTRFWKEFRDADRPLETRLIERLPDGTWRYAAYAWNDAGTEATLVPELGVKKGRWAIPSRLDCLACHEGPEVPILGYSAVQLASPPTIAGATAAERAALGYLHGNCGHCHNDGALSGVEFVLAHQASRPAESAQRVLASLQRRDRLAQIPRRMSSHNPMYRMPPLGVQVPDAEGLAVIERWLKEKQR